LVLADEITNILGGSEVNRAFAGSSPSRSWWQLDPDQTHAAALPIPLLPVREVMNDHERNHAHNEPVEGHPLVRFGHWALVTAFAMAYLSAEEEAGGPDPLHVRGGYVVGAIVVLRVLWGFVGPHHARFGDFVRGPIVSLVYLRDLLLSRAHRYVGHSPAGGAMVIALLICLGATVATGMMAYGEQGKGLLADNGAIVTSSTPPDRDPAEHGARRGAGQSAESTMGELHNLLANHTMALVVAHIFGVAVLGWLLPVSCIENI
jgi:cytochrome b